MLCQHCRQAALPDRDGTPHVNACARFVCTGCGARFAAFPSPLSKRYGADALCAPCVLSWRRPAAREEVPSVP